MRTCACREWHRGLFLRPDPCYSSCTQLRCDQRVPPGFAEWLALGAMIPGAQSDIPCVPALKHPANAKQAAPSQGSVQTAPSISPAAFTCPGAQWAPGSNGGPEQSSALPLSSTASSHSPRPTSQPLPNPFVQSCAFY